MNVTVISGTYEGPKDGCRTELSLPYARDLAVEGDEELVYDERPASSVVLLRGGPRHWQINRDRQHVIHEEGMRRLTDAVRLCRIGRERGRGRLVLTS